MPTSIPTAPLREPDILLVPGEVRSLLRAGTRRPILALVCAALGAFAVGQLVVGRQPPPSAAVTIRLLQLITDEDTRTLSRLELEAYINKVVLAQSNLTKMYKQHLHDGPADKLPDAQDIATWIRDQTKVEVINDRMLSLFTGAERRRSAMIRITVEDDSVEAARRVVLGLSGLVTHAASETQAQALKLHALAAKEAARQAARQADRDRNALATQRLGEVANLPKELRKQISGNQGAVPVASNLVFGDSTVLMPQKRERQWQVAWARAARAEVAEYQAWMRWQSELHVPTVQATQVELQTYAPTSRLQTLWLAVGLAFVFALPVATLCVGAFSPRLEAPFDLHRAGFACLGEVQISGRPQPQSVFKV